MKILFVIDNYGNQTNGTSITAKRFANELIRKGHEVRILSNAKSDEIEVFELKTRYIPIVSDVAKKQKVNFSKPDIKVIQEALAGVDVIHMLTPWKTSKVVLKMAKKIGIPITAAFHVQPENITYGAGLGKLGKPFAWYTYYHFKHFYKEVSYVHCPSQFIAGELIKKTYPNRFEVISNGVGDAFFNQVIEEDENDFHICSIGRFAKEKRQELLIKAIAKSRYKQRIKVTLAGSGPRQRKLKKLCAKLGVRAEIAFFNQTQLLEKMKTAHLYVHTSDVEIEAISCLEAIAAGLIPVIANSKKSATPQFALTEHNLFKAGSVKNLTEKIEYWITHSNEKKALKVVYKDFAAKFTLEKSVEQFTEMLSEAIFENNTQKLIEKNGEAQKFYRQLNPSWFNRMLSAMTYYVIALPILSLYTRIFLNFRVKGKKNLERMYGGFVVVSNHVHTLDSVMCALGIAMRKPIFTGMQANFNRKIIGFLIKTLGSVPVSATMVENRVFFYELAKKARYGRVIHMFPEGELKKGDQVIRALKKGAFKIAVDASVPVIPMAVKFEKKVSKNRKKAKKYIILNIGKPIYPNLGVSSKVAIDEILDKTHDSMEKLITTTS